MDHVLCDMSHGVMDPTHLVHGPWVRTMSNTVTAPVGAVSATNYLSSIYSTRYPASTSRDRVRRRCTPALTNTMDW